jgi:hypothetical protein
MSHHTWPTVDFVIWQMKVVLLKLRCSESRKDGVGEVQMVNK